jgi:hypothetical protein
MAATMIEEGGAIQLTAIDADWDYKASKPATWPILPKLLSIRFVPGATGDRLVVKHKSATGIERFNTVATDTESRVEYYHGTSFIPFVDFSDCTLSAGHKVAISLWREA